MALCMDREDEDRSKLSWYPLYEAEYRINKAILERVILIHIDYLNLNTTVTSDNFSEFYSLYRIEDILVSVTDDLIRYAQYHKIKKKEYKGNDIYSISDPTRAAFFTKWILKLRPSLADARLCNKYISSREDEDLVGSATHKIGFCNEYLALLVASKIFNIRSGNKIVGYDMIFGKELLPTLFYSLRYRLVHQDSYSELYRNVFHKFSSSKNEIVAQQSS